jgi:ABC-type uncharacterized transport system ATPase subunit
MVNSDAPVVLEARGITKRFPGVLANDNVNLKLYRGEILALLGENGAGKSTLMNIIYSLYQPDEGTILLNGQEVEFHSPNDAIKLGIGMVHQHFMLVPVMTVTENIILGVEESAGESIATGIIAALLGGVFGFVLGGPVGLVVMVLLAALFGLLAYRGFRPKMGNVLFGLLAGIGIGLVLGLVFGLIGGNGFALLGWALAGMVVGAIANIRWTDKIRAAQRIRELSEEHGLEVDPDAYIQDLPVGTQQRVEIIKALYRDAKILILDEPTSVLTPQEADDLFEVMRHLTERGVSIIFITHKLREVLAVADQIMVLRRGRLVGVTTPAEATRESLAEMMVGRQVLLEVPKDKAKPGTVVLEVQDLRIMDDRQQVVVDGVSFTVRTGEIVGVAGVQGNGQTQLVEALTGLRDVIGGRIMALDHDVTNQPPRVITGLGTAHIPEDRQRHGLVLAYPITDNLILPDYYRPPFSRGIILVEDAIEENAEHLVEEFDVRTPSIFTPGGKLSGGNQQKVIVARELSRQPKLMIANQPTRGIDVGSIEFIHNQIVAARDSGAGVLLVSAELDEILSLSDRVVVMYRGQIMAEMPIEEATREKLGLLMAGVHLDEMEAAAS